ncbi:MAG: hypothetical protein S4CHLAM45_14370 [Chlamydiales bacterium]|nr:hypothetical protein [Chlamydiales bacterium]MCH9620054.1 hypothetical protein [Chlamydiales bacterium]MCH9623527.1 hypothetical protein [Chlamydiales bacterium]
MKIAIVGGGAAGFFAALAVKEADPEADVHIFESSAKLLSKVRISGGGRCNVTHACFDPKELIENYPRGKKELLGPFHTFSPKETIKWFEQRGIALKEESDGRMFPLSNSSETIIACFLDEAKKLGVTIHLRSKINFIKKKGHRFHIDSEFTADKVILASGSSQLGWKIAKELGHTIVPPIPSLFTFNIPNFSLQDLSGVAVNPAKVSIKGSKFSEEGPLLITHFGFSGPAALKLSAFAARDLATKNYNASLLVDWLPHFSEEELFDEMQKKHPQRALPKSLWKKFCAGDTPLNERSKKELKKLIATLKCDHYEMSGKTTNKAEFVTCGGIKLSEVSFKTMESRCCKNLFFCGEILDIDGITGGFNFQNAWTTGWLAGNASALPLKD